MPIAPSSAFPAVGIAAGADLGFWNAADRDRQLDDYLRLGVTWLRHDFAWDVAEPKPGVFNWAPYDAVVQGARARGINLIATISYTPSWANGGHADHRYAPTDPRQFGAYARAVARRYAPLGVHAYEIWNEPNIGYWQPNPNPAYYKNVLCSAYRSIHAADPHATVLTGGTSPAGDSSTTYSPQTWLTDLYADGGGPCFDAVAHHPYIDSTSTPGDLGNAWYLMYNAYPPSNLRAIMTAHGDSHKRIWATEVGCRTSIDGCNGERLTQALTLWHSYRWAGVLCWFTYWDPNEYGLVDSNWTRRPAWFALQHAATLYH